MISLSLKLTIDEFNFLNVSGSRDLKAYLEKYSSFHLPDEKYLVRFRTREEAQDWLFEMAATVGGIEHGVLNCKLMSSVIDTCLS